MGQRLVTLAVACASAAVAVIWLSGAASASGAANYDINTLAGKVASLNGTAGLQIRFSALIQEEADADDVTAPTPATPITPTFVLSSPLDGTSVLPPDVTVNQDTAAAPQNETAIAVDPNNPNRVVSGGERLRHPHVDVHDRRHAVQRPRRRLLGHVLLQQRRPDVVLHEHRSRRTSGR